MGSEIWRDLSSASRAAVFDRAQYGGGSRRAVFQARKELFLATRVPCRRRACQRWAAHGVDAVRRAVEGQLTPQFSSYVYTHRLVHQVARKNVASAIGPTALKSIRHFQELESRILLQDLMDYGDKDARSPSSHKDLEQHVPRDHWFSLIRRFVCTLVIPKPDMADGSTSLSVSF